MFLVVGTSEPYICILTRPFFLNTGEEKLIKTYFRYLDASDPDVPTCVCKTVTLELLPADSDCILPPG